MSIQFKIVFLATLSCGAHLSSTCQKIDTLLFNGFKVIPHSYTYKNEPIEELSGIAYSGLGNQYYVAPQSKSKAHIFLCTINSTPKGLSVSFDSVIYFSHGALEAESIRLHPISKQLYFAEERDKKSYIYKVTPQNKLVPIYTSTSMLRSNSGYEGLCFDSEGKRIFIGVERPLEGITTHIIAYNLENHSKIRYKYTLDNLPFDKKKDNGITELLCINDTTLLVVERAYLGSKYGNSIRVYKAIIPKNGTEIIKEKQLTNFSSAPKIDNIEGVAFSPSKKELIFISDNNANIHQKTLFIQMKIGEF